MRPVLPLGVLVVVVMSWRCSRRLPNYASSGVRTWVARGVKVALVLFVSFRTADALLGRSAPDETIALAFPLHDGRFYVGQGGSTLAVNYHTVNRTQRYALDIVKVTDWGNRASRLRPGDLRDYASYGVAVYAPCSGTVAQVETSLPDNVVDGERNRTRPAGNQILVRCDGSDVDVLIAHLQAGSVRATKGEHIEYAKRGGAPDTGLEGEGVPMTFDGRFLVRNDIVSVPCKDECQQIK